MTSQIGDYVGKRIKCNDQNTIRAGLNSLSASMVDRKREKLLDQLEKRKCNRSREQLNELLTMALADENRIRGLGDVVHRVASAVGIKQKRNCGCGKRRAALNRVVPFGGGG